MGSNHRNWSELLPSSALNHQPTNSVYFWSLLCQATELSKISTEGFSYHSLNLALTPSIFWVLENSLSLLERCLGLEQFWLHVQPVSVEQNHLAFWKPLYASAIQDPCLTQIYLLFSSCMCDWKIVKLLKWYNAVFFKSICLALRYEDRVYLYSSATW